MSDSNLYDTDILTWSERQAELLRRRATGELVNYADLDWPNIAEEVGPVSLTARVDIERAAWGIAIRAIDDDDDEDDDEGDDDDDGRTKRPPPPPAPAPEPVPVHAVDPP